MEFYKRFHPNSKTLHSMKSINGSNKMQIQGETGTKEVGGRLVMMVKRAKCGPEIRWLENRVVHQPASPVSIEVR